MKTILWKVFAAQGLIMRLNFDTSEFDRLSRSTPADADRFLPAKSIGSAECCAVCAVHLPREFLPHNLDRPLRPSEIQ